MHTRTWRHLYLLMTSWTTSHDIMYTRIRYHVYLNVTSCISAHDAMYAGTWRPVYPHITSCITSHDILYTSTWRHAWRHEFSHAIIHFFLTYVRQCYLINNVIHFKSVRMLNEFPHPCVNGAVCILLNWVFIKILSSVDRCEAGILPIVTSSRFKSPRTSFFIGLGRWLRRKLF